MLTRYLPTVWTTLLLVATATAQGVVTELLENNATAAHGTTLNLQVERSAGTAKGQWFSAGLQPVTDGVRYFTSVDGTTHTLTITGVQDSDAGLYYYFAGTLSQGTVNVVPSVVNGGFSRWGQYIDSDCSVTCGGGTMTRTRSRTCDSPAPMYGGANCTGNFIEEVVQVCGANACPGGSTTTPQELKNNATAVRGRTVIIQVTLASAAQGAWFGAGQVLTSTGKFSISVSGRVHQLTITNVQDADAGQYFLFGNGFSVQGYLNVVDAPQIPMLCQGATRRDGVGYRYHPTDCDKYIQCYYNPNINGNAIGVYRSCPFGYYWNQVTYRCDESWNVECPIEKCNGSCGLRFKIAGSCGAYWECGENGAEAMCCSQGFSFVHGKGCRRSAECYDLCPNPYTLRETCDRRPMWTGKGQQYERFYGSLGWRTVTCEAGTAFDVDSCGCKERNTDPCIVAKSMTFANPNPPLGATVSNVNLAGGIATFNQDSSFTVDVRDLPLTCPKVLSFRYRETVATTGKGSRVLAASTDSMDGNNIMVSVGENALHFMLKSWTGNVDMMSLSTAGMDTNAWKRVTLQYDSHHMTVMVESGTMTNRAKVYAPGLMMFENKLRLGSDGSSDRNKHFIGFMDDVSLFTCDPGFLY